MNMRNAYRIVVRLEAREIFMRTDSKYEENIKLNFKEANI
jgi:hypothetical protein